MFILKINAQWRQSSFELGRKLNLKLLLEILFTLPHLIISFNWLENSMGNLADHHYFVSPWILIIQF
jgi:hypothetical protein